MASDAGAPPLPRVPGVRVAWASQREIVIIKPARMASELTTDRRGVAVIERVKRSIAPDAALPHRLDRVTRGLLLVALDRDAAAHHSECIRRGAWHKLYLARVNIKGNASADGLIGEHHAYLKRVGPRAQLVRAGGKPARLDILAAAPAPKRPDDTHLLIRLHTGRFHQIRAMLAGLGVPLVGDHLYAGPPGPLYLEHAALRFTPAGAHHTAAVHVRDDREREKLAPRLAAELRLQADR